MLNSPYQTSVSNLLSGPVEIVFGHQGPDCLSRGICRMETPLEMAKMNSLLMCSTSTTRATLHYYQLIDRLNLSFELSEIDARTWRDQFADGFLELNRHFLLSKSVCAMLGINRTAVIPNHTYPVQVVGNRIEVIVPVMLKKPSKNFIKNMTRTHKTISV